MRLWADRHDSGSLAMPVYMHMHMNPSVCRRTAVQCAAAPIQLIGRLQPPCGLHSVACRQGRRSLSMPGVLFLQGPLWGAGKR